MDYTVAKVHHIPKCNFHPDRDAVFDGKTQMEPWAFMCQDCMDDHGVGLGLGRGQKLVKA